MHVKKKTKTNNTSQQSSTYNPNCISCKSLFNYIIFNLIFLFKFLLIAALKTLFENGSTSYNNDNFTRNCFIIIFIIIHEYEYYSLSIIKIIKKNVFFNRTFNS